MGQRQRPAQRAQPTRARGSHFRTSNRRSMCLVCLRSLPETWRPPVIVPRSGMSAASDSAGQEASPPAGSKALYRKYEDVLRPAACRAVNAVHTLLPTRKAEAFQELRRSYGDPAVAKTPSFWMAHALQILKPSTLTEAMVRCHTAPIALNAGQRPKKRSTAKAPAARRKSFEAWAACERSLAHSYASLDSRPAPHEGYSLCALLQGTFAVLAALASTSSALTCAVLILTGSMFGMLAVFATLLFVFVGVVGGIIGSMVLVGASMFTLVAGTTATVVTAGAPPTRACRQLRAWHPQYLSCPEYKARSAATAAGQDSLGSRAPVTSSYHGPMQERARSSQRRLRRPQRTRTCHVCGGSPVRCSSFGTVGLAAACPRGSRPGDMPTLARIRSL